MNAEIKARWVERLRALVNNQGRGKLKATEDGVARYCCLGVLCEIAVEDGVIVEWTSPWEDDVSYFGLQVNADQFAAAANKADLLDALSAQTEVDYSCTGLPESVIEWAGIQEHLEAGGRSPFVCVSDPRLASHPTKVSLIGLNDSIGWDFNQIANAVEGQL